MASFFLPTKPLSHLPKTRREEGELERFKKKTRYYFPPPFLSHTHMGQIIILGIAEEKESLIRNRSCRCYFPSQAPEVLECVKVVVAVVGT